MLFLARMGSALFSNLGFSPELSPYAFFVVLSFEADI